MPTTQEHRHGRNTARNRVAHATAVTAACLALVLLGHFLHPHPIGNALLRAWGPLVFACYYFIEGRTGWRQFALSSTAATLVIGGFVLAYLAPSFEAIPSPGMMVMSAVWAAVWGLLWSVNLVFRRYAPLKTTEADHGAPL